MSAYEAGKTQNLPPIAGTNGEVLYAYGQSLPTLVTAPLHTSLILLEPGLKDTQAIGLSPAYWSMQTIKAGNQPELAITPRFKGLHSNLVITGTGPEGNPRNYVIEMTSDANRYTPVIGFYYPGPIVLRWKATTAARQTFQKKVEAQTVAVLPAINPSDLDFHWRIECGGGGWFDNSDCRSIEPTQVFDDGRQTFIHWKAGQASYGGIPSVLAENAAGQNAIVNTQFRDGYTIVDGVPPKILLLAGKGRSAKVVKLVHEGKK
ncbi:TrbG/VirB9 family P-type conjugative transfer protein [Acidithiobacillus thiooxidans]|uniref:Conjugal transfer protein TrbG n=2 Tax=Acidithiobacillus TaxID=119977 RepID=A0A1C2HWL2_ACITH|nr:TrbG/VirB9 family P-type conjugative transfer protein [Acidithiobacillus sulfurivorans]MBU2837400.1 TrbG/VirB9 family P-type conjugative transfer protein [Acidithiobacillus thiooxidans]OCX68136.1 conjugal transfer protein TrbG [Acidithiobacillus thiooxidans]OCX80041.1 conjugal transfer protein TrbG [Acidithiobacillus thiooxidans]